MAGKRPPEAATQVYSRYRQEEGIVTYVALCSILKFFEIYLIFLWIFRLPPLLILSTLPTNSAIFFGSPLSICCRNDEEREPSSHCDIG
jgi:hypothetical protein